MNSSDPILAPDICPLCMWKPCRKLTRTGRPSIVLVGRRDIPHQCPLLVPEASRNRYSSQMSSFSLSDVVQACSTSIPNTMHQGIYRYKSSTEAITSLQSQGYLRILAAPLGSPGRNALNAWQDTKLMAMRRSAQVMAEGEAAEREKEKPKPAFLEATWVWLADPKKMECEEKEIAAGSLFDSVWCKVDTQGLMPGDSVTFNLFLKGRNGKEDLKITTETGWVGSKRKDNAAVAKWVIPDLIRNYKIQAKLDEAYFIVRCMAHGLEMKSPLLKFIPVWKIWLQIDVDHPKAKDDELILTDESGAEVQRVKVSAMKEIDKDFVELSFQDLDMTKKYTLMRDYGPDEDGGKEYLFEDLTPEYLDTLANGT